jgi:hypothetical protein
MWKILSGNPTTIMPREEAAACLLTIVVLRDIAGQKDFSKIDTSETVDDAGKELKKHETLPAAAQRMISESRTRLNQQVQEFRVPDVLAHRSVCILDTTKNIFDIAVKDVWSLGHVLHLINTCMVHQFAESRSAWARHTFCCA